MNDGSKLRQSFLAPRGTSFTFKLHKRGSNTRFTSMLARVSLRGRSLGMWDVK